MLENEFEAIEIIEACEKILESRADTDRTLWAIIAALKVVRQWMEEQYELA